MTLFPEYLDSIARVNRLVRPVEWLFYPGMLQDSPDKWWGDWKSRHALHEGIDFCFYRSDDSSGSNNTLPPGSSNTLAPGSKVPAMAEGTLLNIADDLLGQSLVVSYSPPGACAANLILVYSHLTVDPTLCVGNRIQKGQVMAQTFDTRTKGSKLLSHLHLSCIDLLKERPGHTLNWNLFPRRDQVNILNPIFL